MAQENVVRHKTFVFVRSIIKWNKELQTNIEFVISKQILRSATSVGAIVEEASAASTKRDFAYKMSITTKEARETQYCLRLLQRSELIQYNFTHCLNDIDEIIRVLTSSVKTAQKSI